MVQKIAVVGSGVSGSLCARLLATKHDVTLFEAADRPGGHTNTVEVEAFGGRWAVDTGFMVFNDRTYPNFIRMLKILGVTTRPSDMSFSVQCTQDNLEYQGSSLNGLFAQRGNLVRPRFYRLIGDIFRFNRQAVQALASSDANLSLEEFLRKFRYSPQFAEHYLLPMTAAIWSAPPDSMREYPLRFLVEFMRNHGLLQVFDRPQWRTIPDGALNYLQRLLRPLESRVRTDSRVLAIRRFATGVEVEVSGSGIELFDKVVLAVHAPQALQMLSEPTSLENELLPCFAYQENQAVVHTDTAVLPSRRRAWASWNYCNSGDASRAVSVTYDLSRLQGVDSPAPILQTLNPVVAIAENKVLMRLQFEHPLFTQETHRTQTRHDELHRDGTTYFCGAYWGYGFHEDGVNSALQVCKHFDITLEDLTKPCKVVSMKAKSDIPVGCR